MNSVFGELRESLGPRVTGLGEIFDTEEGAEEGLVLCETGDFKSLSFLDGAEEEDEEEEERCGDALDCDSTDFVGTDTRAPGDGLDTFDGAEVGVR